MTQITVDQVALIQQRFIKRQQLTHNEIAVLLQAIDMLQEECSSSALVHLSKQDVEAMMVVYNSLLTALRRAGLHLHRATAPDGIKLPWVWFYRWERRARQGPFGTLEAAVGAAMLQLRSGVLCNTY